MNWSKNIDIKTFNDAYLTYKNNYNKYITVELFLQLCLTSFYKEWTSNYIKRLNVENAGLHRLSAKTIEEAFMDKPRCNNDIISVKYHCKTKDCISPIVIIKYKNKNILLDGVHRLVATHFRKSKIRVLYIEIP